jgi:hypothetical protein
MATSAPRDVSSFTTATRLYAAAYISAVWPFAVSRALMSTPASSSIVTAGTFPDADASISGVDPVDEAAFGSEPASSSSARTSAWPCCAARNIGV